MSRAARRPVRKPPEMTAAGSASLVAWGRRRAQASVVPRRVVMTTDCAIQPLSRAGQSLIVALSGPPGSRALASQAQASAAPATSASAARTSVRRRERLS